MIIALFGATGSGKSVQGQLLAHKHGFTWLSSRELLTALKDKEVNLALRHGITVDDEKAMTVLADALREAVAERGEKVILDGFPSSVNQVYWMVENGFTKDMVCAINLRVPRGELWKRLMERKRVDDTRAAIERRQDLYDRVSTGIMRTLNMNGVPIREVDGSNEPKDVLARIEEVLGDYGVVRKKEFAKLTGI